MKTIHIVHNPTAGSGNHSKEELIQLVERSGYRAEYISTDNIFWNKQLKTEDADAILLAGGDGTVKKLAKTLIEKKHSPSQIPIHIMPLGTANNISKELNIAQDKEQHEINLDGRTTRFSYGKIKSTEKKDFFLESFGFGIFPKLISEMKKKDSPDDPEKKLKQTLEVLLEIVKKYKPKKGKIKTSGFEIKGKFLLVEVMNIKLIGPNFALAPNAHPADDHFDLVLIPKEKREELETYIIKLLKNEARKEDLEKIVTVLPVQKVNLNWSGSRLHIDDNLISDYLGRKYEIQLAPEYFKFFTDVPNESNQHQ
ncbi:diacylglycerol/lipid kinase family protein [Autumnicola psychrophila]|uniref:Diacylglycerol kinase family protein n=1 Tax=Autumnicola psychrophila TaxID=3075592 RepID=A0ABU3DUP5_9FLAO|nr:diacylglycerol kinase family protein [Zunongwangia sp. F225]MDT0687421.1 diacylglycerol kinase family protein [Zunongwangia sp. F225]